MNPISFHTKIREYKLEDKPQVMKLFLLNTPQYFSKKEEADLHHYLDNERELFYVMEYNGRIIGCGGINFVENGAIGKLSWDIFHPDYQGKSLGTELLQYRISKLKSTKSVLKITVRTSQLAYGFYEKQGFELLDIVKDYWADGFDLYHLEYKEFEKREAFKV